MIPVKYNCRNLAVRWKTTLLTSLGFVLVVAVLMGVLAFINGLTRLCIDTGQPDNVLLLKKGANDEGFSQIDLDLADLIASSPDTTRELASKDAVSDEMYVVLSQPDEAGKYAFLSVRGVEPAVLTVHSQAKIAPGGRMCEPNSYEVVVGRGLLRQHPQWNVGGTLTIGRPDRDWKIVGVLDAAGSSFESEVWVPRSQLVTHLRKKAPYYTSMVLRAKDTEAAQRLAEWLDNSQTYSVHAMVEPEYYKDQAETNKYILVAGWVVAGFMGLGAVFGVMNTMFAAINQRIKDIGVLRVLGFTKAQILGSFLLESLLIATIGGLLGCGLSLLFNLATNVPFVMGQGGRAVAFAFQVDLRILTIGMIFSLVMGFLGGLLPAFSAVRGRVLDILR